jgi:hypothetical protein
VGYFLPATGSIKRAFNFPTVRKDGICFGFSRYGKDGFLGLQNKGVNTLLMLSVKILRQRFPV